ncbi:protein of unknown function [Vibrio xiamenensis]|uniref:DUF4258 domain-containing protein n=1 Tax=Vibrio xiamenensis TaxID=861298 RepID=A0A1G8CEB6_9VIBR|nr:DUF4258 domain-containing protein [Vibrio xiamenensis]SDH43777.1 protein of unknown function [Vibrio xiamenensis]
MPNLTKHAKTRCQQRGIDPTVIDILMLFGIEINEDNEAEKLMISKRDKKQLLNKLNKAKQAVEKNIYTVISHTGEVITAAHKYH